ncbi:MAG TPA: GntR family transcriptional regulator [Epulopiscium sp.]|nr:GntR family transcriptional regulator [Candidatus Epulonipiscium sp.]
MQILERKAKETAREYAFRIIKYNIISLELEPGSMISEKELAEAIGVSRTPVREALIELSKLRIVEIYPQKGSFISLIDSELVEEVRFIRLVLEHNMVALACEVATPEDIILLEENLRLHEFYLQQKAIDKQLQLDNKFHKLLFSICNKDFTHDLLEGMMAHFDRVRSLSLSTIKHTNILLDHKAILNAIIKKDKVLAIDIITSHLSRYKTDEEGLKKQYPHYFKET